MKIYAVSGLGAEERVFQHLQLPYDIVPILWDDTYLNNPSLSEYALLLTK